MTGSPESSSQLPLGKTRMVGGLQAGHGNQRRRGRLGQPGRFRACAATSCCAAGRGFGRDLGPEVVAERRCFWAAVRRAGSTSRASPMAFGKLFIPILPGSCSLFPSALGDVDVGRWFHDLGLQMGDLRVELLRIPLPVRAS